MINPRPNARAVSLLSGIPLYPVIVVLSHGRIPICFISIGEKVSQQPRCPVSLFPTPVWKRQCENSQGQTQEFYSMLERQKDSGVCAGDQML